MNLLEFRVFPGTYAVCALAAGTAVPAWARGGFVATVSTSEEVSIVCEAENVPAGVRCEKDWRVLQWIGPFPFDAVGIMASISSTLASARIPILAIGSYHTDYVLVKEAQLEAAIVALVTAGYRQVN